MNVIRVDTIVTDLIEIVREEVKEGATGAWYDLVMDAWVEYSETYGIEVSLETRRIIIKDTVDILRRGE